MEVDKIPLHIQLSEVLRIINTYEDGLSNLKDILSLSLNGASEDEIAKLAQQSHMTGRRLARIRSKYNEIKEAIRNG